MTEPTADAPDATVEIPIVSDPVAVQQELPVAGPDDAAGPMAAESAAAEPDAELPGEPPGVEDLPVEELPVEPVAVEEPPVEPAAVAQPPVEPAAVEEPPVEPAAVAQPPVEPAAVEEPPVEPVAVAEPPNDAATEEMAPVVIPAASVESTQATAPAVPAHSAPRRRRRWPWVTLVSVLLVLALALGGALWHFSGLIGAGALVDRQSTPFPMTITEADGPSVTFTGPKGGQIDQGLMGLATIEGGYVHTDAPVVTGTGDTAITSRSVLDEVLPPAPAAGEAAALDGYYVPRNPAVGLGLAYQDVVYESPLGPTPAWVIPGTATTWVVYTHGRGATPLEGLRIANTATGLGYPVMLIRYRNDAKSPEGNGYGQFGADEWQDLEAAVQYALDNGAENVVLAGASMGGAITLGFLQNSTLGDRVLGAFLDAPVADFGQVVDVNAADMGVPTFLTSMAKQVASWRYGFDWTATDYTAAAAGFTTPMLIVQGTADDTVPAVVNEDFAAAADPAVVDLELFDGAGHVMSWNIARPRYEELLTGFLARVAPTG